MLGDEFLVKVTASGNNSLEFVHHHKILLVGGSKKLSHVFPCWCAPLSWLGIVGTHRLMTLRDLLDDDVLGLGRHHILVSSEIAHTSV